MSETAWGQKSWVHPKHNTPKSCSQIIWWQVTSLSWRRMCREDGNPGCTAVNSADWPSDHAACEGNKCDAMMLLFPCGDRVQLCITVKQRLWSKVEILQLHLIQDHQRGDPEHSTEENIDVTPQTCAEQSFKKPLDYQGLFMFLKGWRSCMNIQISSCRNPTSMMWISHKGWYDISEQEVPW